MVNVLIIVLVLNIFQQEKMANYYLNALIVKGDI